jgi:glycosyltransferase involved in cell wall biosynthesis
MDAASNQHLTVDTAEIRPIKRVLIDARKWRDGGIGTYTRSLIRAALTRRDINLSVILNEKDLFSFKADFERDLKRISFEFSDARGYSLKEYLSLARKIDWSKYDIYHSPHYTLPYNIPVKKIVTIHDLIHITNPQKKYYPVVAKCLIGSALSRADQVVSVSRSSANELQYFFDKKSKVAQLTVVPNALEYDFVNQACNSELPSSALIAGEYWLAVISRHKPHKGALDLLRAFGELNEQVKSGRIVNGVARRVSALKLVLVGPGSAELMNDSAALKFITDLPNVQVQGKVPKAELLKLYAHASAVIVPSLAEGFGLPVLEAHAFGCPVVMRPVPALVEQALAGDFVCSDYTEAALKNALLKLLNQNQSSELESELAESAKRQALTFSYEQMGKQLAQCYAKTLIAE